MPEPVATSHVPRATSEEATRDYNGTIRYVYDPFGRRVWEPWNGNGGKVSFYGADGALLGSYYYYGDQYWPPPWVFRKDAGEINIHFAGRLIRGESSFGDPSTPWGGGWVYPDRLGSTVKHFPYGEEYTTAAQNRVKFATYYRDSVTALDYAQNRYYSSTIARFTSPDPYVASGGPADPQSWNRYAYVQNDPVNFNDRQGLKKCLVEVPYAEPIEVDCPGGDGGGYGDDPAWPQRQPVAQAPKKPTNSQKGIRGIRAASQALMKEDCAEFMGRASDLAIDTLETATIVDMDLGFHATFQSDSGGSYSLYVAYTPGDGSIELNNNPALNDLSQVPVGTLSNGQQVTVNLLSDLEGYYGLKGGSVTPQLFWAIFELHELGHMLQGLPSDKDDETQSKINTGKVIDHCFKSLKK